jgi:hypothetical protein
MLALFTLLAANYRLGQPPFQLTSVLLAVAG